MYMFWQQTMSLVDPTSCDLCLMHCDSYTCLGLNIGYIQLANLWHSLPCWVQMIRHAYQLRDSTPEDVGPPAQALQPLACGNHHYPLFKHFPPAAVKLQVGLLLLLPVQAACLWKLPCSLYLSPPSAALLSPHCARAAGGVPWWVLSHKLHGFCYRVALVLFDTRSAHWSVTDVTSPWARTATC